MTMIERLHELNDRIANLHNSKLPSLDEKRKRLAESFGQAIALRAEIDRTDPTLWEDAPEPDFEIPNQPRKWFLAAVQAANSRNARRKLIKARLPELRSLLSQHSDAVQIGRIESERRRLVAEAWELGPFEPTESGDSLATSYLKLLAWSMREDAESAALHTEGCIECGNMAMPGTFLCSDCGTFDESADADRMEREEAMLNEERPELLEYNDARSYEYDPTA